MGTLTKVRSRYWGGGGTGVRGSAYLVPTFSPVALEAVRTRNGILTQIVENLIKTFKISAHSF